MPWLTDLIESRRGNLCRAFLYCVYKSGLLPLFAGVAAQQGLLEIGSVWMSVLAGGIVADELGSLWLVAMESSGPLVGPISIER